MHYKEFRIAAHRHLISCEKMCEKLSELANPNDKRELIAEIYYLSGYIVETLLSYAIFSVASRDIQRNPIEQYPDYENGFKTHDFRAKIQFALTHGCNFDGFLFISVRHSNNSIMRMFSAWQVEMRYQHFSKFQNALSSIDDQLINNYIVELSKLEKQFNQKYI